MDGFIFLIGVVIGAGSSFLAIEGFYNVTEGWGRVRWAGVVQLVCAALIPTLYVSIMFLAFP